MFIVSSETGLLRIWRIIAARTSGFTCWKRFLPTATPFSCTSGAANWVQTRQDGVQFYNNDWMMDPGDPDVAQWIVDDALSIVRNYNVDGINLDRIRYPDGNLGTNVPSWGYNPTSIARFQAATGRSDIPANTDAQWTQWRRDQITSIVRKIYIESFAARPSVRVASEREEREQQRGAKAHGERWTVSLPLWAADPSGCARRCTSRSA